MTTKSKGMQAISRKPARSGNVDYGDPIILHENSRTRVALIPFFIPHSNSTELSAKIVTYKKADPPQNWVDVKEKSISLNEEATWHLYKALHSHLAVAEENENGDFLVIKINEGSAEIGAHEPLEVAKALTQVLGQEEILDHLQNTELTAELASAFRGAIRLSEMRSAVTELRLALDEEDDSESTYQDWCERHSWAFGNAYIIRDDVRAISAGDNLDLLLPSVMAGYRDIVELKRPGKKVLMWDKQHNNYYFSSEVSKAIGQCHRYLDVLHEEAASGLRDHPEIVAYHPRATIVIGRSHDWEDDEFRALRGLNHRLSGINVMTYDHLLAQGERLVELLSTPSQKEEEGHDWDDDLPF